MGEVDQREVWDKIAGEWERFRDKPGEGIVLFLKKQKGNVLDLGAGTGRHLLKLKKAKMWLVDFSEKMLEFAKQKAKREKIKAEFVVSETEKLPFKSNFFDGAICVALLHCIETKKKREDTIKELFRVLKPKARAKIAVWNKNSEWFKKSKKERHMKWRDKGIRYLYLYEDKEIYDLFEKNEFKIIKKFKPGKNIVFVVEK